MKLFVLDNSIRESTVGQLRGHTIENKWQIYNEIPVIAFDQPLFALAKQIQWSLASTHGENHFVVMFGGLHIEMTAFKVLGKWLDAHHCGVLLPHDAPGRHLHPTTARKREDFNKFYAFSEFLESIDKNRVPDSKTIPIGLRKCKELGIKHVNMELDLVYRGIDYTVFTDDIMCQVLSDRMAWVRENLYKDSHIFFNLRDLPDCMKKNPERLFKVVNYLSSLPPNERPFGLVFEESGKYLPEELGVWTSAIRKEMDDCGFKDGHLLVHVHEQWGMQDSTQLEILANGANGVWASLCTEGASMGHSTSTVMLMNLIRLGNKRVLKQYNCTNLREAAYSVTMITTGKPPHPKQVIYGERALDMVFGMPNLEPDKKDFSMTEFFGQEPVMRMSTMASPGMIVTRLTRLFGTNPTFTEVRAKRMLEVMLEDLHKNIKEEYECSRPRHLV
ncbi:hypothetical protein QZH41_002773 [Actinostola sp. cb2023]|nr:hypothetical protein QZH41_002773 [Actinostola sp. cb2023]